jgi:hypothetical protein
MTYNQFRCIESRLLSLKCNRDYIEDEATPYDLGLLDDWIDRARTEYRQAYRDLGGVDRQRVDYLPQL